MFIPFFVVVPYFDFSLAVFLGVKNLIEEVF